MGQYDGNQCCDCYPHCRTLLVYRDQGVPARTPSDHAARSHGRRVDVLRTTPIRADDVGARRALGSARSSAIRQLSLRFATAAAPCSPGTTFDWLSAFLAGGLRQGRLALRKLLFRGRWQQTFPDGLLPSELAGPANGLGFFARLPLRRLLVGTPLFHFPEDALALHLLLQNTKCLVYIVVANKDLQLKLLAGLRNAAVLHAADCAAVSLRREDESDGAILRRPRTSRPIRHGDPVRYERRDHSRAAVSIDKAFHASTGPFEASRTAPEVPAETISAPLPCKNAKVVYIRIIRLAAVPC
jgi:hypothetical protein